MTPRERLARVLRQTDIDELLAADPELESDIERGAEERIGREAMALYLASLENAA